MSTVHRYDHVFIHPDVVDGIKTNKLETISERIEMYPVQVTVQEPMLFFNSIRAVTVFYWLTALLFIMYIPLIDTSDSFVITIVVILNALNLVSLYGVYQKSYAVLGCFHGFELGLWTFCSLYMGYAALFFYTHPGNEEYMAWYLVYICAFNFYRAVLVSRIYGYIIDCDEESYLSSIITRA